MLGEATLSGDQNYSSVLLPAVVKLLKAHDLRPDGIQGYAVTTGPGSFTGLRIGVSTVQGLALASERPCVGITALDVHASRILGESESLVVLMEAYRDEVYAGVYDGAGAERAAPAVEPLAAVLARVPAGSAFVGDAVPRYRDALATGCAGAHFPERSRFLAATLARLAAARLARGETKGAAELRPFYLREAALRNAGR